MEVADLGRIAEVRGIFLDERELEFWLFTGDARGVGFCELLRLEAAEEAEDLLPPVAYREDDEAEFLTLVEPLLLLLLLTGTVFLLTG